MTNSLPEIEDNDVIFIIGSNTKENHPIVALRMLKAVKKGAKIIIADPRKVPLVRHSALWIQQKPGTDVALLNSMMHVIVKEGMADEKFIKERTEGYDEFLKGLDEYTPEYGEKITGVPKEKIIEAARMYGKSDKVGTFYTMGITQHSHGTENVYSLANLVMLTGNIGKRSTGLNPLRGQNNVQGSSDMGGSPVNLPGYQSVTDEKVREKFEIEWGTNLPSKPGITAIDMMHEAEVGKLKALYIMGENPALSDPDIEHTKKALKNLDLLIVQDIFLTETAELAHVVLPAVTFAEKNGTFTNTDRRVQRVRKAVEPPGEAKEDSWIIMELSKKFGYDMNYENIHKVFLEIGKLWPAFAGIDYSRIRKHGIQWPCPTKDHKGTPYLFKDGFLRGKGKFTAVKYRPSEEQPDQEYPFILTTGRELFQYHTGTMTRRVKAINEISSGPYIEVNPDDAKNLSIEAGNNVCVTSRRGSITLKAKVSDRPDKGVVFIPFHFKEAAANVLTNPKALDPVCKIPELKVCAVTIKKA